MRKGSVQLRGELEPRIHGSNFATPDLCEFRSDRTVKRCIDLDYVEELRHVFEGMNFARRQVIGIKDPRPVLIRPAGGADENVSLAFHDLGWPVAEPFPRLNQKQIPRSARNDNIG